MNRLPGLLLAAGLGLAGWLLGEAQRHTLGFVPVEPLVGALLLGIALRAAWAPGARWAPGVAFAGKELLELGVAALGLTLDPALLARTGGRLLGAVAGVVTASFAAGVAIGRAAGLGVKPAILVASGNAICGNSAIAAVAPTIGARREDVAAAIAFTAVLGVAVVLGLPAAGELLGLDAHHYGVLAGLTVYAVPQVLAATLPVGAASAEVGTLVKLTRVVLLGPLVFALGVRFRGERAAGKGKPTLVPWFVLAFVAFAVLRALGAVPAEVAAPVRDVTRALTTMAMGALGLGVEVQALRRAGRPTALAVLGSFAALFALGLLAVTMLD